MEFHIPINKNGAEVSVFIFDIKNKTEQSKNSLGVLSTCIVNNHY